MQVFDRLGFSSNKYGEMLIGEALEDLQTGDIIFLHGRERSSRLIQFASRSFWSHCGMVVRGPLPQSVRDAYEIGTWLSWLRYYQLRRNDQEGAEPTKETEKEKTKKKRRKKGKKKTKKKKKRREKDEWDDDLYIFESDLVTVDKREGGGVQLVPLRCWLEGYSDFYESHSVYIIVKRLFFNDTRATQTATDYPELEKVLLELCNHTFDKNLRNLAGSIPGVNHKRQSPGSIFCSELVVKCYQAMGLLPTSAIAKNFVPKDFLKDSFQMLEGATLDAGHRLLVSREGWTPPPAYDDSLYSRYNRSD